MAYDASGLSLANQLIGGKYRQWVYQTTDAFATVDDTDYFALAGDGLAGSPNMKLYDIVLVEKTDTASLTWAYVSAIDSDYNVTVTAMAFAGAATFTTLTTTSTSLLGDAAADLVGFHGSTGASQPASSVQATSNIASSSDFGATQTATMQAMMTCLTIHGLWKGTA